MMSIAFIGATFLACDTQPTEAIDDPVGVTESDLKKDRDPEVTEYDPRYLDDLANRTLDVVSEILPRLDEHEIEMILARELTSREALEMDEKEYAALWSEIEGLSREADDVLADPGWNDALDTPYFKKNIQCGQRFRLCFLKYLLLAGATGPAWGSGILVAGTASDCVCNHCTGKWRDRLCGKDEKQ